MKRKFVIMRLLLALILVSALWIAPALAEEGDTESGECLAIATGVFPDGWGEVTYNASPLLSATPSEGRRFVEWRYLEYAVEMPETEIPEDAFGPVVSTDSSFVPELSGVYTAIFEEIPTYAITLLETEHGSISLTLEDGVDASHVPEGALIQMAPVPDEGYEGIGMFVYFRDPDGRDNVQYIPFTDGVFSATMPPIDSAFRGVFVLPDEEEFYNVTLDANGGRGLADASQVPVGERYYFRDNPFTREGYELYGWCADPQGEGVIYQYNDSVVPDGDAVYYAIWAKKSAWKDLQRDIEMGDWVGLFGPTVAEADDTPLVIPSGSSVTLDLGSHILSAEALEGYAIIVQENAQLTLTANGGSNDFEVKRFNWNDYYTNRVGSISRVNGGIYNEGTLVLQNGVIEEAAEGFAAVYNKGVFDAQEGVIADCAGDALINEGDMRLQEHCSIVDNAGAGVVNLADGFVYMDNAYIAGNGLGIDNRGEFEMHNGRLFRNAGGAVGGVSNSGQFTAYDPSFEENTGESAGALLNTGVFRVNNGWFVKNSGGTAGAILSEGELELTDGEMYGNTAANSDGAGAIYMRQGENARLRLCSDIFILDNSKNGAMSNVFLPEGLAIELGEDTNGSLILGVSSGAPETHPVLTSGLASSGMFCNMISEHDGYIVELNADGEAALIPAVDEAHTVTFMLDEDQVYAELQVADGEALECVPFPDLPDRAFRGWQLEDGSPWDVSLGVEEDLTLYALWATYYGETEWQTLQTMMNSGGYLRLPGSFAAREVGDKGLRVPAGVSLVLDLYGNTLDGSNLKEAVITIEAGAELTLTDSQYTPITYYSGPQICGASYIDPSTIVGGQIGSVIDVHGTFSLVAANITGGSGVAGVQVHEDAEFNMYGGYVFDNRYTRHGGVYNEGVFNLKNGTVGRNMGWDGAGGVTNRGVFTMNGGLVVKNSGTEASGVVNYGTFDMRGGLISENTYFGEAPGAVLNTSEGHFMLSGGRIANNLGVDFGGVCNLGRFDMSGGVIAENAAGLNGVSGVLQSDGVFTLSGGSIVMNDGNGAAISGVGVEGGVMRLSGNPRIEGNSYSSDLALSRGQRVEIVGPLTDGLNIGLCSEEYETAVTVTSGLAEYGGLDGFFSNTPAQKLALADGEIALIPVEEDPDSRIYPVVYCIDGMEYARRYVAYGELAPDLEIADRPEYTHQFWYADGLHDVPFDFENTPVTEDLYLDSMGIYSSRISFDSNGAIGYMESVYTPTYEEFTPPDCDFQPPVGRRFVGWVTGEGYEVEDTLMVNGDTILRARWDYIEYGVTVDDAIDHGVVIAESDTYRADEFINLQIVPDKGYGLYSLSYTACGRTETFDLLGCEDTYSFPVYTEPGDVFITAVFKMIDTSYSVDFCLDADQSPVWHEEVKSGKTPAGPPENPGRRGNIFLGWAIEGESEPFSFDTPVFEDLRLVALWQELPGYTVALSEFGHGGATLTATVRIDGEVAVMPVEPGVTVLYAGEAVHIDIEYESGYGLTGLLATCDGDGAVEITDGGFLMPEGDVLVTVTIEAAGDYTITPVCENIRTGGGTLAVKEKADADEVVPFRITIDEGCRLQSLTLEYEADGEPVTADVSGLSEFTMPAANATLRAVFSDYAVRVDEAIAHGAILPGVASARTGESVALTVAPEEGYILETLSVKDASGQPIALVDDAFVMPAADVDIEAAFRLDGLYRVAFVTGDNAIVVPDQEVWEGDYIAEPTEEQMQRTGYLLLGWRAEGETAMFDFANTPVTGDTTLTAQWEKLCRVGITSFMGDKYETQYVRVGECAEEPQVEPIEGYTLQGWCVYNTADVAFDFSQPITGDITILAEWYKNITTWAELETMAPVGEVSRFILMDDVTRGANGGAIKTKYGYSVKVNLNGHTLNVNGLNQPAFLLANNSFFTLMDRAGGGTVTGATQPVIYIAANASATMISGCISGNSISSSTYGGVVYSAGGGTFIMYGGAIENNTVRGSGGAVFVDGSFTMRDGVIRNNTATANGGGVYIASGGMNLFGGEILNNTASGTGGGIGCSYTNRYLRMTGGLISGNTAATGGGVYSAPSTDFEFSGGRIVGNTATEKGGGLFVGNKGLSMHGSPTVTGNTLSDGSANNLYIQGENYPVTVYGLNEDARVGITSKNAPTCVKPIIITDRLLHRVTPENMFSDDARYQVIVDEETGEAHLVFTEEAIEHDWDEPVYTWSEDNTELTATRACKRDATHVESETVAVTCEIVEPATCEAAGQGIYTSAPFENEAFEAQTKTDEVPALGHDWSEPVYTWSEDYTSLTAERACRNDEAHVETETVEVTIDSYTAPTCAAEGHIGCHSAGFENDAFEAQNKEEVLPALGHVWGEVVYTWSDDNTTVTATRICERDAEHVETETVEVTSEITVSPTCTTDGQKVYTSAAFENTAFEAQTRTEVLPALGHVWGEVVYTWSDDNTTVTATRICERDAEHVETETVEATRTLVKAPTEDTRGEIRYAAQFANGAFGPVEKVVDELPTLAEMKVFVLPAFLKSIEAEAFMGNAGLEAVILPEGCGTIGAKAFAGCVNLRYVRIPASVTDIAADAFEGCERVIIDHQNP